jgi:ribonuclease VapC
MFVDASAIVAILGREPGHEEIEKRMAEVDGRFFVSPLVKFEASVALARQKAITPELGRRALDASAVYGKVVGHRADLNFGDCFTYACAKHLGVPLIYKGKDFAHTDIA